MEELFSMSMEERERELEIAYFALQCLSHSLHCCWRVLECALQETTGTSGPRPGHPHVY